MEPNLSIGLQQGGAVVGVDVIGVGEAHKVVGGPVLHHWKQSIEAPGAV